MPYRTHDRTHFYKYVSRETALKVISSKSFRWSSPLNFNDPFDHQSGFILKEDRETLARHMVASFERLIFGDAIPKGDSPFTVLLPALRQVRHRLPKDAILADFYEKALEASSNLQDSLGQLNSAVQTHLCHSRVFCVTEDNDNVVMWSHYAEEHKGVVFKLACVDDIDNPLLCAKKVRYTTRFVSLPDPEVYAKHLTSEEPLDLMPLVWEIAYTKHLHWQYEKEWRVHIPLLNEPEGDGYSIYPENPRVFEAVYLGCRMPEEDAKNIIAAIRSNLPSTKIYRASKNDCSFSLDFKDALHG